MPGYLMVEQVLYRVLKSVCFYVPMHHCANDFFFGTWKPPPEVLADTAWSDHWAPPLSFVSLSLNDINILEFWPVVWAVVCWGHLWRSQKIVLYTDYSLVLYAINSIKSHSWVIMGWLREIF